MTALLNRKILFWYAVAIIGGLITVKVKHLDLHGIVMGIPVGLGIGIDFTRRYYRQKLAGIQDAYEQLYAYSGPPELMPGTDYAEGAGQFAQYSEGPYAAEAEQYGYPGAAHEQQYLEYPPSSHGEPY